MPLKAEIEHDGGKYRWIDTSAIPIPFTAWCRECGEPFVFVEVYEEIEPPEFRYYDGSSVVRLGKAETLLYVLPCGHHSWAAKPHLVPCCLELCP